MKPAVSSSAGFGFWRPRLVPLASPEYAVSLPELLEARVTMSVTQVSRVEPDPARFEIPEGYKQAGGGEEHKSQGR